MAKFEPKKGELVAVCYDGKSYRWELGTVVDIEDNKIFVIFHCWAETDKAPVKCWFYRTSDNAFGAYVKVEDSLMKNMGIAEGDWYSVFSQNNFEFAGLDSHLNLSAWDYAIEKYLPKLDDDSAILVESTGYKYVE